ncbi:MAG: hypothetical protein ACE5JR_03915 [Gemmatimonadota bacterium]
MPPRFEELRRKKVAELRQIAEGLDHDALHGYRTMHKEQLIPALCAALGIEAHEHHEVIGINKRELKAQIRELKLQRAAALQAGDKEEFRATLKRIHRLKRKLRRAWV